MRFGAKELLDREGARESTNRFPVTRKRSETHNMLVLAVGALTSSNGHGALRGDTAGADSVQQDSGRH